MTAFRVEWRQFRGEGSEPAFLHRLAQTRGAAGVLRLAASLGDTAWRREFLVSGRGREVYTDLHGIEDWVRLGGDLPRPSGLHVWLSDLRRDLAADVFLVTVAEAVAPAVAAGVLASGPADALVRFSRRSVLRPRI